MSIDLTRLPMPTIVDMPTFESILEERKKQLIDAMPLAIKPTITATLELESEPLVKLLQENVYRELILRARINEAIKATFLATATGVDLEHIAASRGIERKIIQEADLEASPQIEAILETDQELRHRVQLFPEKLAAAGPKQAYYAHALDADVDVVDAQVVNADSLLVPAGTVRVYIKAHSSEVASGILTNKVHAYLNSDMRRPLCDTVEVMAATGKKVSIKWINRYESGPDKTVVYSSQLAAINDLISKNSRIGAELSLSKIIGALDTEGVKKIDLISPINDVKCGFGEFPIYVLEPPLL